MTDYELTFDDNSVFRRISDGIYQSDEAGVREPIQNSITAVEKAKQEQYIEKGLINIDVTVRDDDCDVVIQDNGVGLSEDELENYLTVIGMSSSRNNGDITGKFGFGFLAVFKFVGLDGGFTMQSKSRRTDEEIKGIWKPDGFNIDDSVPDILSNNYGTALKLTSKPSINTNNVIDWVEKYSEYSKIPVNVRIYKNNEKVADVQYCKRSLKQLVNDTDYYIHIDNDYYEFLYKRDSYKHHGGYESDVSTYLRNAPIESSIEIPLPGTKILRIKKENGIIIKGDNKDKIPVNRLEYNNLNDKSSAIIRKNDNDVQLPDPTGSRDALRNEEDFNEYLNSKIEEIFKEDVEDNIHCINQSESINNYVRGLLLSYDDSDFSFLHDSLNSNRDNYRYILNSFGDTVYCRGSEQTLLYWLLNGSINRGDDYREFDVFLVNPYNFTDERLKKLILFVVYMYNNDKELPESYSKGRVHGVKFLKVSRSTPFNLKRLDNVEQYFDEEDYKQFIESRKIFGSVRKHFTNWS